MWTRLFAPDLPSPLSTKDLRHKKVRERLIEEDGDDARPSSCKKRARYSIHPIFEKYKPRKSNEDDVSIDRIRNRQHVPASLSPELESPLVKELHRKSWEYSRLMNVSWLIPLSASMLYALTLCSGERKLGYD
jgi:hypothetical protein